MKIASRYATIEFTCTYSEAMAKIDTAASCEVDPKTVAQLARLRYVNDAIPGIGRIPTRSGFRYVDSEGKPMHDQATLARIKALAIPPAWRDVWICPSDNGHVQATGRDAKGRKQYRYHRRWRTVRDELKYDRMIQFGRALPTIRRHVHDAMSLPGIPREKALATVVFLLQQTMMRIGNEEYARANRSFGLTTLRNRHVRIEGASIEFAFTGKSGVRHQVKLQDPRLARIVKRLRELPGQDLFQYVDDEGELRAINSADVNDYLRALADEDYTAKDFRTWFGTVLAAQALLDLERHGSATRIKKNITCAIKAVAERLGNTPAICRKCYVHPLVLEAYQDGTLHEILRRYRDKKPVRDPHALRPEEAGLLALLKRQEKQRAERRRGRVFHDIPA